jgi:DNA-binding transcriptional regulator YiaG
MKCTECGNAMTKSVGDHVYRESGMDHVTLKNITKYSCESCGAKRLQIVAIGQLHQLLAGLIAKKPARLMPSEVRFIRDHLELSNRDFAVLMGVTETQASRWTSSEPIGVPAERFLRILAVLGPVTLAQRNLPEVEMLSLLPTKGLIETLGHLPSKDEPVTKVEINIRRSSSDWKSEPQAVAS